MGVSSCSTGSTEPLDSDGLMAHNNQVQEKLYTNGFSTNYMGSILTGTPLNCINPLHSAFSTLGIILGSVLVVDLLTPQNL